MFHISLIMCVSWFGPNKFRQKSGNDLKFLWIRSMLWVEAANCPVVRTETNQTTQMLFPTPYTLILFNAYID